MVTAWQVYWVMQLDSISMGLFIALAISLFVCWLVANAEEDITPFVTRVFFFATVPIFLAFIFLPSSKTAAAMILLPAITSESVTTPVGKEARELYDLAKQALGKLAREEKKESK